jgi:hypothetical protein
MNGTLTVKALEAAMRARAMMARCGAWRSE